MVNDVPHIASGIGGVVFGVWSMASGMDQSGLWCTPYGTRGRVEFVMVHGV